MTDWLNANADGLALAIVLGLLAILALVGALLIERLVESDRDNGIDRTAERHRRVADNGRRVRAGMRVVR